MVKLSREDALVIAILAILLMLVVRQIRQTFGEDDATGESIVGRVARDFAMAGALYIALRVVARLPLPYALVGAGTILAFSVAGGWIRGLLEGRRDEGAGK